MKPCKTCGIAKPPEDFNRLRSAADGRQPICRECVRVYMREYNAKNMARIVERTREWRKANPEQYRASNQRSSRTANAKGLAARRAARAALVRFCEECGESIGPTKKTGTRFCSTACQERDGGRRWRQANPEKRAQLAREYEARNRGTINRKAARRRAWKRDAFVEDVHELVVLEMDDGVCGICGEDVDPFDFHVDHVIPLAKGGEHSYANVQTAHPACNVRKNAHLPWDLEAA
jgi:5-methylcytosine-specific restriction endonuclease McrA